MPVSFPKCARSLYELHKKNYFHDYNLENDPLITVVRRSQLSHETHPHKELQLLKTLLHSATQLSGFQSY